ncbi:hypothetical protein PLESTM_001356300 [Pleodorina starrii]|nr:hypothetical protein PLESTM_001356300 [Pleodorina starrii]
MQVEQQASAAAQPATVQAADQAAASAPGRKPALNLAPSSDVFARPCADDQETRNILAAILKRMGNEWQSDQVSPYFKTYLQRGLSKVRLQLQHAAHADQTVTEQSGSRGNEAGKAAEAAAILAALQSRLASSNLGTSQSPIRISDPGELHPLEGPDEATTMRNWALMHDRLRGEDWDAATQAMKLLCYSYMEIDKHNPHVVALLMDPRNADELVHLLSQRIEHSLAEAAASTMCLPNGPTYNARACKYSVNALMNLCNVTSLTTGLTDSALQRLCSTLIACLIDARLRQVPEGDDLLKAVNMLIMKLLEHANRLGFKATWSALSMLHPATAGPDGGAAEMLLRWNDMVVKCLIKMTKQLGALMPTLNGGEVLVHIHGYMQNIGADEVRRRSLIEDKPLRMVKTMLHELCKQRGYEIYKDVDAMPGVTESKEKMVMMPYIRLNLNSMRRAGVELSGEAAARAAILAALQGRFRSSNLVIPKSSAIDSPDSGAMGSLEGPDEETTMRNWALMHDRLRGEDWDAATQAMKLLYYSYMEIDKHNPHVVALLMDPRNADELVHLLSQRIEQSLANAAASTMCLPNGPAYHPEACMYSVNALMRLLDVTSLTAGLTDNALRRLCSVLIACLIDARLRQVPEGEDLYKIVNILTMKLVEHANKPGLFGGFIHCLRTPNPRIFEMLHPATAGPDGGAAEMLLRWNDMVVKCLIKMTKQLGALMSTLNVSQVLVHIHGYMQDLGADEVRRRNSIEDKPLRMVKTMLHELCKKRGYEIYKDVDAMPGKAALKEVYRR